MDKKIQKREKRLERKITREYQRAYNEIQERATQYLKRFEEKDKEQRLLLKQGKISNADYLNFRRSWLRRSKEYDAMLDDCTEMLTNADVIARSYVRGEQLDMFAISSNYAAYDICKDLNLDIDFTIYNKESVMRILEENPDLLPNKELPKSTADRWNKHHIQSEITQGIIQGKSVKGIAEGLQRAVKMGKNASIRNARTAMASARSAGSIRRYQQAKEDYGIETKKQWIATLDGKTRHEHRKLDGQIRELDEPFEIDGDKIRYPADPQAEAYLVYNCRCSLMPVVGKYDNNFNFDYLGAASYEEWEKGGRRKNKKVKK